MGSCVERQGPAREHQARRACSAGWRLLGALGVAGGALACAGASAPSRTQAELEALSESWVALNRETFSNILEHALAVDEFVCTPEPNRVFFGDTPAGVRLIRGSMPHYNFYYGPMQYSVRRQTGAWHVGASIAVQLPELSGRMELPDCSLAPKLDGAVECSGQPFTSSRSRDVCPSVGHFTAPVTRHNVHVLLRHWTEHVSDYYNRDAHAQRLPLVYEFEFIPVEAGQAPVMASLVVPLATTCGRTPYFHAMRSGWSLPILAHEIGHVLGLLDEYEMFSGIFEFYPKTPFAGAERSRMGLSMREESQVLPLHHYLVLRRYFCPEPTSAPQGVRF